MGGEKASTRALSSATVGSPPRRRGKASSGRTCAGAAGITPAWAGKSRAEASCGCARRDHPRVGGEKTRVFQQHFPAVGSPPHGRGKEVADEGIGGIIRITPAWAGKSVVRGLRWVILRDHPRVGGEKLALTLS